MWLLIVPLVLIGAVLFVLGSLVAGVIGLLGAAWPVVLIVVGMWLFWHEDGRHRHGRRSHRQWAVATHDGQPVDGAATASSSPERTDSRGERTRRKAELKALRHHELPADVQARVERIREKVAFLLTQSDRFPPFSQDLYLVRQTASDYLPRTLNAYLALPGERAEQPLAGTGTTAHQELKAQLDLLNAKLDEIARDLQRQDADRLLANRRFLEDRFETRDLRQQADKAAGVA
jgi:hypothetical protein